jgi:hypothetical protein
MAKVSAKVPPESGGVSPRTFIAVAVLTGSLCLAMSGCKAIESAFDDEDSASDARRALADQHDHGPTSADWSATSVRSDVDLY